VEIDRTPFAIGSGPGVDLALPQEGLAPIHARIVVLAGVHHLVPFSPDTALTCEGRPVPPGGVPLAHGARIQTGSGAVPVLRFLVPAATTAEREDRLMALMEIARTITSALTIEEVLERILDGAVRFSGAQRGYLFLKEGDRLVPWTRGAEDPASIEVSRSVAEEVARTGRPVYRDVAPDDTGRPVTASFVRLRLQAALCVPLAVRGEVIGVVYLDSRLHLPHHRPELPLLEALAGLAAVAIQNSRLIEERVRTERTLLMGQMARVIVHDLRSPMSAIRGLAQLLRDRAPQADPARPHLETIMAEIDRLTRLTGDLLQFSREAPPLQRRPARLADLARETLKTLDAALQRATITVVPDLDDQAVAEVDAPRLVRVLHNLIANAVDAMPSGGRLELRCAREATGPLLQVRDNGGGMPPEVLKRIFEPFFTHGKAQGTGLGMAIVRKIVDEHGGRIAVDSGPGQGTCVTIRFPAPPPGGDQPPMSN
jgi:signal transduction histidine kinase